MTNETMPNLLYYSIAKNRFSNKHICDFSTLPRPFFIVSWLHNGGVKYNGSSATVTAEAGDIMFIPQGETYKSRWSNDSVIKYCTSLYFSFTPESNPLSDRKFEIQVIKSPDIAQIKSIMEKLYTDKNIDKFHTMSLFYSLCHSLFSCLPYEENTKNISAIKPALDFISENYKTAFSVKDLAEMCHMSESHFHHVFTNLMSVTPVTYKNSILVNHIIQALKSEPGKSIEAISEDFGFSSTVYFRKLLKKFTQKTPTELRKATLI